MDLPHEGDGGKNQHKKLYMSETGASTCEFNDLHDCLGFDQPSKAVEWLIKAAIQLPWIDPAALVAMLDGQQLAGPRAGK
jgi:hypothetical protein